MIVCKGFCTHRDCWQAKADECRAGAEEYRRKTPPWSDPAQALDERADQWESMISRLRIIR